MVELEQARSEYLAWVRGDPEASDYTVEARLVADEELLIARDETRGILFGSLVAYGFSLLETALRGCVEELAAIRQRPAPRNVRPPMIEGWLDVLNREYGVSVGWDPEASGLGPWRRLRNRYLHQLEVGDAPTPAADAGATKVDLGRIEEFLELVEEGLAEIDRALAQS